MVAVVTDKAWRTRFGSDPTVRRPNDPAQQPAHLDHRHRPAQLQRRCGRDPHGFWLSISSVGIGGPFAVANLDRRQDHWYGVKARLAPGVDVGHALAASCKAWPRGTGSSFRISTEAATSRCSRYDQVRMHPQVDRDLGGWRSDCSSSPASCCCSRAATLRTCCSCAASRARRSSRSARRSAATAPASAGRCCSRRCSCRARRRARARRALVVAGICRDRPVAPYNTVLDVRFDYRMVVFSVLAALGTGFLFGLLPSWRSAKTDVATALRDAGRTQSSAAAPPSCAARWSRARSRCPSCSSRLRHCSRGAS